MANIITAIDKIETCRAMGGDVKRLYSKLYCED